MGLMEKAQEKTNNYFHTLEDSLLLDLVYKYVQKDFSAKDDSRIPEYVLTKNFKENIIRECARRYILIQQGEKK